MTEYDQRIALAEFDGWKRESLVLWLMPNGQHTTIVDVPDYLHDLNAMHRVEHKLNELQRQAYVTFLTSRMWLPDGDITTGACFQALHADAAQRAEALLRTIGKWTE